MTNTTENTITTRISGDTFPARDVLRTAGFAYDKVTGWTGTDVAKAELARITRPTYSRKNSRACAGIVIETL